MSRRYLGSVFYPERDRATIDVSIAENAHFEVSARRSLLLVGVVDVVLGALPRAQLHDEVGASPPTPTSPSSQVFVEHTRR